MKKITVVVLNILVFLVLFSTNLITDYAYSYGGHGHWSGSIWIGPGWGPWLGYPYPYYPYVQQCPGGWMKVAPSTVPPDVKE